MHTDTPVTTEVKGTPDQAIILLHGRGASAAQIMRFGTSLAVTDVVFIAPQAEQNTWYPAPFMQPVAENQPWLDGALDKVAACVGKATDNGFALDDTYLLGFSQGACLAAEYAARNPDRYGGVFGLSGGLIGETVDRDRYSGDMAKTPVFLGCSDQDPHIPVERIEETAAVFDDLNAAVEQRIYEGMGHTINQDEKTFIEETLTG